MYQFVSYLYISIFLSFIIFSLFFYAMKNRTVLGARFLIITLLLVEVWIVAQALEMAAIDLQTKLFWANIQYIPIMLTPVAYLFLALQFTRREKWLNKRWIPILLLIIPLAMNILLWTDSHGLIRQNVSLDLSGTFPTVKKTYGPLFWLFAINNYVVSTITFIILLHTLWEKASIYKKQIAFLIAALSMPVIANLLQITGLNPFKVDITPAFFGFSALMITWGIFRYRLFNIVPIAHSIIIQEMRSGMIILDNEGRILDINPAALKMLNLTSVNLIGHSFKSRITEIPDLFNICHDSVNTIREITTSNGNIQNFFEVSYTQIKNTSDETIGWLLQIYDITERKTSAELIQHAAHHDSLTGLSNRSHFQILFSQALAQAEKHGECLTTAFLDINNFKSVNDTYGHHVGDKVLCEVANSLKRTLNDSNIIARIGGDGFALVLPNVGKDEDILLIGSKISQAIKENFNIFEGFPTITASIGFCVYPRDGDNDDILLKKADKAMYMSKSSGIDCYIYKENE